MLQFGIFHIWPVLIMVFATPHVAAADEIVLPTEEDFSVPRVIERLARRIEPDMAGKPERLAQYVDFFRSELGNDSRLFAFNVTAQRATDGKVELRGYVEFPETRTALAKFLTSLGFKVEDRLETLPASALGKEIFGFVKTAHSVCYDRPSGRQRPENDCLVGEPLYLLREESGHLLAHSGEGYLGYIPTKGVLRVDAATFARYLDGPRVRVKSDQKVAGVSVPAGATLKWVSNDGKTVTAELPDRKQLKLPAAACEQIHEPTAMIDKAIASGRQLIGTRYLWGGKTSEGIDCSGLVQISYAAVGVHLPRDSYQQFYTGRLSATRWHMADLRRGDTLYFLGPEGKIRHTAIYIGEDRYLQATVPTVRINSFNPTHPDYSARLHASFAFAKRPMD